MKTPLSPYDSFGGASQFDDDEERRELERRLSEASAWEPPEAEFPEPGSAGKIGTMDDFGAGGGFDAPPPPAAQRSGIDYLSQRRSAAVPEMDTRNLDQGLATGALTGVAGILDAILNKGRNLGSIASGAAAGEMNRVKHNEGVRQFNAQQAESAEQQKVQGAYRDAQMRHWDALEGQQSGRGQLGERRVQLQEQAAARKLEGDNPDSERSNAARSAAEQLGLGEQTAGMSENQIKQFMTRLNTVGRMNDAPQAAQNAATQAGMVKKAQIGTELDMSPEMRAAAAAEAAATSRARGNVALDQDPKIAAATTRAKGAAEAQTPEAIEARRQKGIANEDAYYKGSKRMLGAYDAIQRIQGTPRSPDGSIAGFSRTEQLQSKVPFGNDVAELLGGERLSPDAQNNISNMLSAAADQLRDETGAAAASREHAENLLRTFGNATATAQERETAMMNYQRALQADLRGGAADPAAARAVSGRMGLRGLFDEPAATRVKGAGGGGMANPQNMGQSGGGMVTIRNKRTGETMQVTREEAARMAGGR